MPFDKLPLKFALKLPDKAMTTVNEIFQDLPITNVADVEEHFKLLQTVWGCRALVKGKCNRIKELLHLNLQNDKQQPNFRNFVVGVYADPPPIGVTVISCYGIEQYSKVERGLSYRLWKSTGNCSFAAHSRALLGDTPPDVSWPSLYRQSQACYHNITKADQVIDILESFHSTTLPPVRHHSLLDVGRILTEKGKYQIVNGQWDQVSDSLRAFLSGIEPSNADWHRRFIISFKQVRFVTSDTGDYTIELIDGDMYVSETPDGVVLYVILMDTLEPSSARFVKLFRTEREWSLLIPYS